MYTAIVDEIQHKKGMGKVLNTGLKRITIGKFETLAEAVKARMDYLEKNTLILDNNYIHRNNI